jgi:tetrahydrodipicolinate N-succinyltransferase
MSDVFDHLFGGKSAPARRWRNPDGSEGGIVAVDARIHPDLIAPADVTVWPGASIGDGASIGYRASIGEGASIGDGASIGYCASIGDGASIGGGASIGYCASIGDGASIGGGASIGEGDWWLSGGPCGSRKAFWTAVFSPEHGLRWWVGCKQGVTTDRLRKLVAETHGSGAYADDYAAAIAFVESHPGLLRARAEAESVKAEKAAA